MNLHVQLQARPDRRYSYSGRSLLVTDVDGWVTGAGTEGFYFDRTRLLCRAELTVNGRALLPAGASPVGGAGFLSYGIVRDDGGIPQHAVVVETSRFLGDGMRSVIRLENEHPSQSVDLALALHLAADFADMDEADSGTRLQTAPVEARWDAGALELQLHYCHPELDRALAVRVEDAPAPITWGDGAFRFDVRLGPHKTAALRLAFEPIFAGERIRPSLRGFHDEAAPLARVRRSIREETPRLTSSNATVARAWETAVGDLATFPLGLEHGPATPIAGLPVYQQFFGRDSLTIGWQSLLAGQTILRDALRANAAWQGTVIDDWLDEEPGKLIHQANDGPLAALGINPFIGYFGDYATPPDFLAMLGQYLLWSNDRATVRALLPAARKTLDWLNRYGDLDGDGFLDYVCRSPKGVKNQGWKDSQDAIVDELGNVIENPIATCEIQGYWYAALQQMAIAFFFMDDEGSALELLRQSRALQARFDRAFWMPEEGFYAIALGPDKRQVRSIASNAGQLLVTGIVPKRKGPLVARRLLEPDLFSGWGVRTLSARHIDYNPFSYHLGSVWPVEAGTIALGCARYDCFEATQRVAEGMFAATDLFADNRLPEVMGGVPRDDQHPHPGFYPTSNVPQGWSTSSVVTLVQALIGMRAVAPLRLLLIDPHLPEWLPDLRLDGIRVGDARVGLAVWRTERGETRYRVTERSGNVRVLRQPAPDGPSGSLLGRARAVLGSIGHS